MADEMEGENAKELLARKNACIEKMYSKDLRGKGEPRLIKTEKEVEELQEIVPEFLPRGNEEIKFGHIQNYLAKELEEKFEIEQKELVTNGYKIQTSFDSEIQTKVENIINENANEYILSKGGNNGASVILDGPTGGIVAMIGSRDFNNSEIGGQFNVTTAYRQPGSSYKPYVYASAMEKNSFNPGTVILDAPTDFGNWVPKNFSRTNYGLVSIRYSLQNSLNVPAVKSVFLSQDAKNSPDQINALNNLNNFVSRTGVQHNRDCDITSSLGSCEVTMISHTTGFNTLLQEGNLRTANPFVKIVYNEYSVESDRKVETILYERDQTANNPYPKQDESIKPEVARETADILSDYGQRDARIWGRIKSNLELDGWTGKNSVAAKTGTTSNVKDAWTVGGSPYYTVSVWIGNTDNKPMNQSTTGSTSAAPLWKLIMTELHKNKEKAGFSKEGLVAVKINPSTGLPDENGITEYMTRGQLSLINQAKEKFTQNDYNPMENSIFTNRTPSTYRKLKVDIVDEKLISEETELPEAAIKEIECGEIISEFPISPNWFNPAKALQDTREGSACPTEVTELTEDDLKPEIESNFEESSSVPARIKIQVSNKGEDVITNNKLVIKADGEVIYESQKTDTINKETIEIKVSNLDVEGTRDVVITVTNSLNLETSVQYQNVNFDTVIVDEEEITESDIDDLEIDCAEAELGENTSCKIDPLQDKVFPSNLTIFIGENEEGGFCDKNGICASVPTEDNTAGEKEIFVSLDGTFASAVKTKYTAELTSP
jgi:membrane peptidoglycan carboxypeptidase